MYEYGEGVPKDEAEAYFWLNLGASDEIDRSIRDDLEKKLSRKKRLEIQERCHEWVKTHPEKRY